MLAIGLMSGTSLDGIDCSLVETNGQNILRVINNLYMPYPIEFQIILRKLLDNYQDWLLIEKELTNYHATCVNNMIAKTSLNKNNIQVIGFHGQTIYHNKKQKVTWQIGNPHQLEAATAIRVVSDFRRRDIACGGNGAPLIPIFHQVITNKCAMPVEVINIGGVSNITYIENNDIIAFDIGPGNALINDAMRKYYRKFYDDRGQIAAQGRVNEEILSKLLNNKFFELIPPKSLDRNEFIKYQHLVKDTLPEDIIATLTKFTVAAIISSIKFLPKIPKEIYICGGGVKNQTMMKWLKQEALKNFDIRIMSIKKLGLDPDFIESQGFAYLAARCLKGLHSSFFSTTLASKDTIAGVLF